MRRTRARDRPLSEKILRERGAALHPLSGEIALRQRTDRVARRLMVTVIGSAIRAAG
jgi:hypothetical protein